MNKVLRFMATLVAIFFVAACTANAEKLDGSQWRLALLNGKAIPSDIEITLEFIDGRAGGKGACNGYGADYKQTSEKLKLGSVVSTMMYCEGVMDIETEHLKTFDAVTSFKIENEHLRLLNNVGVEVLVFEKQ